MGDVHGEATKTKDLLYFFLIFDLIISRKITQSYFLSCFFLFHTTNHTYGKAFFISFTFGCTEIFKKLLKKNTQPIYN